MESTLTDALCENFINNMVAAASKLPGEALEVERPVGITDNTWELMGHMIQTAALQAQMYLAVAMKELNLIPPLGPEAMTTTGEATQPNGSTG